MNAVGENLDLERYLQRIGIAAAGAATLDTLQELVLMHARSIAFENLSSLAGEPVSIDPVAVEQKMVAAGRGGYCFEHNTLMWAVLERLGFEVTGLAARVRWGAAEDSPRPIGHMALKVNCEGHAWLVDVGFGGLTITRPLRLDTRADQATDLETFRLDSEPHRAQTVSVQLAGAWAPLYSFESTQYLPGDYEAWNWFTCTSPTSPFVSHLMAARPTLLGRHAMADNRYSWRPLGGEPQVRQLRSGAEMREVLVEQFGINVPDSPQLKSRLASLAQLNQI